MAIRGSSVTIALASLALLAVTNTATACAIAISPEQAFAKAMEEKTLIVWDPDRKMEHFIRSVTFDAAVNSLGFIVPTPSKPKINESDESVFGKLQGYVECKLNQAYPFRESAYRPKYWTWLIPEPRYAMGTKGTQGLVAGGSAVRVLQRSVIAGMDVAVLSANDSNALVNWLGANHFDPRPGLLEWSKQYVANHWIFTVFKYIRPSGKDEEKDTDGHLPNLKSKTVRLSFASDRAIYPYREPKDAHLDSRDLAVFLLAPTPMKATLNDAPSSPNWHIESLQTVSGSAVPSVLASALPGEKFLQPMQITEFHDATLVRPDSDIVFESTTNDKTDFNRLGVDPTLLLGPFIEKDKYSNFSRKEGANPFQSEESATVENGVIYKNHCVLEDKWRWCELSLSTRDILHSANDLKYWLDFWGASFTAITFNRWPQLQVQQWVLFELKRLHDRAENINDRSYISTCQVKGQDSSDLSACHSGGYLFSVSKGGNLGTTTATLKHEEPIWSGNANCDEYVGKL